jgi:hypothetical protein
MTDYLKSTGSTGKMMIRDTGTNVEYWINSGNSQTYDAQLPWAYVINGVTSSWRSYNYVANSGWQRLASFPTTYSQLATFKLGSTGTQGFGGPTTFSVNISRATVPAAPNKPMLTGVTFNTVEVSWTPNGNGGSTITEYQIGYGTTPSAPATFVIANSPYTVTNLATGTVYYFWVRAKNALGWSAWSPVNSVRTYLGVYVNVAGTWKLAVPYVRDGGVWKQAQWEIIRIIWRPL